MTMRQKNLRLHYLTLAVVAVLAGVAGWIAFSSRGDPLWRLTRGAALTGYGFIFLSILSSACTRQLRHLFGRPFVQMHHILALTGLTLATLHPIAFALDAGTPGVLIPKLESWNGLMRRAGCPAWGLLITAAAAALWRKPSGKRWRMVHLLTYLAFVFITVHAMLLGSDTQTLLARAVGIALTLVALGTAIRRR